jgi:hypothetical protein
MHDFALVNLLGERVPAKMAIALQAGWNIVGYRRTDPADAVADFQDLIDNDKIIIIKNNEGLTVLPEWGFNRIGDLHSGQGYPVKTTAAVTLTYLPDHLSYEPIARPIS